MIHLKSDEFADFLEGQSYAIGMIHSESSYVKQRLLERGDDYRPYFFILGYNSVVREHNAIQEIEEE